MKTLSVFVFLALFQPVFAQDAAPSPSQPPKDVDDALRARVTQFYQNYITGKFSDAYAMVAPEAQNAFIESGKAEYQECRTTKVEYGDNFTTAQVSEVCKGEWHWHGHTSPSDIPVASNWKILNGQWVWYWVKPRTVPNPFAPNGVTVLPPDYDPNATAKSIPKDLHAVAQNILHKVNVDKMSVSLRADSQSKDEVHVRNDMPGAVHLALAPSPVAGMTATASKVDLKANETAVITVSYAPDDKSIVCGECASRIRRAWVQLTVEPTEQVFQIEVNFTNQKTEQFPLPKQ